MSSVLLVLLAAAGKDPARASAKLSRPGLRLRLVQYVGVAAGVGNLFGVTLVTPSTSYVSTLHPKRLSHRPRFQFWRADLFETGSTAGRSLAMSAAQLFFKTGPLFAFTERQTPQFTAATKSP